MSVSNDNKRPVDIVMDADGCWRALYADGSLGPALSTDQMLDTLPLLQEVAEAAPLTTPASS
jgi:hypothetical protein